MFFQIMDSIFIMNLIIFCLFIKCSQSIFRNHNWQTITACNFTAAKAKPHRIYRPIPICCHKIWIYWILIYSLHSQFLGRSLYTCCIHRTIRRNSIHWIILTHTTLIIIYTHECNLSGSFFQYLHIFI